MKMKWHFTHDPNGTSMAGAVTTSPPPCYGPGDFIAFVPKLGGDQALERSRLELIALLPTLIRAAEMANAAAVPNRNMPRDVRNRLKQADAVIRKAKDLLELSIFGPDALNPDHAHLLTPIDESDDREVDS
jgi:hypothetical protein